jgi:hypothetical protein
MPGEYDRGFVVARLAKMRTLLDAAPLLGGGVEAVEVDMVARWSRALAQHAAVDVRPHQRGRRSYQMRQEECQDNGWHAYQAQHRRTPIEQQATVGAVRPPEAMNVAVRQSAQLALAPIHLTSGSQVSPRVAC